MNLIDHTLLDELKWHFYLKECFIAVKRAGVSDENVIYT